MSFAPKSDPVIEDLILRATVWDRPDASPRLRARMRDALAALYAADEQDRDDQKEAERSRVAAEEEATLTCVVCGAPPGQACDAAHH